MVLRMIVIGCLASKFFTVAAEGVSSLPSLWFGGLSQSRLHGYRGFVVILFQSPSAFLTGFKGVRLDAKNSDFADKTAAAAS